MVASPSDTVDARVATSDCCVITTKTPKPSAQHEREMISERTKAALAAAKRRGKRLGNPNLPEAAKRGVAVIRANARRFASNVRPIIDEIMRTGVTSHNAIAAKLNERNVPTARGGRWTHMQVGAILHLFAGDGAGNRADAATCDSVIDPPAAA